MDSARRLSLLLATLTSLAGCGQDSRPRTDEESGVFLVSRATAESLGKQSYAGEIASAREKKRLDADPEQVGLVAGITDRIVAVAKQQYPIGRDWDWEMHVLSNPTINAYCAPGGKMVVLSGLLEAAEMNPDRIATVIGHEISHALLEHARSSLSRDWMLQSGVWIVSKSLKMGTARSQSALDGLNTVLLPMARDHEREADVLGLELMAKAGFNPQEGVLFWRDVMANRREAGAGQKHLEAFTSTHPTDEERLSRLSELARKWHVEPASAQP